MAEQTALRVTLHNELAAALNMSPEQLQLDQSFLAQGGDSLSAIHVMSKLRSFGINADIVDFLQTRSLSEVLAVTIAKCEADGDSNDPLDLALTDSEHGSVSSASASSASSATLSRQSLCSTPDALLAPQPNQRSEAELARFAQLKAVAPDSVGHVDSAGPCSSMQNRILISQAVHAGAYSCSFIITARTCDGGPLTAHDMAYHWRSIVARHPSLRTTFVESEERPSNFDQIVWDQVQPSVTILEDVDEVNGAQEVLSTNAQVPHHLYLAQISPSELLLKFNASHAIIDGRSAGILLRDLCNAFSGELSIATSLRHADFALVHGQISEDSEDFWRTYLRGAEESYLPGTITNKPKTGLHTLQAALPVSAQETRRFCDRYGVTLVNVCQVAWGMVLRSFALKEDVSFSYVTSGRQTEVQGMHEAVGLFISSLVLRMDFAKNTKVLDMLRATNGGVLRGMLHDNGLQRKSSKWGNSILSFQRAWESESNENDSLRLKVLRRLSPTDYDHSINVELGRDNILVDYGIWTSTSDVADADKILGAFLRSIAFILTNPESELGDMDVLGDDDLKRLQEVNGIPPPPCPTCIHTLVEEMVSRQPDAMAVCAWDGTMTYREVDEAANMLARHLVDLGVGPEVIVGACMDKSRWMTVSTLAILKAGGVVLPLSIQQPLARLEIVLKDTKVRIVLVDAGQMERLGAASLPSLHRIQVDAQLLHSLDFVPTGQIVCLDVRTSHAAWIVYTSGSTGVPKGVVLQHSALCSSIKSHGAAFGVTRESRVLQFASHTFDVTIQETFTTLCQGGCVCVPSEQARLDSLEEAILSMDVNFLSLTSTVAGLLSPAKLSKIRTVILMGEPVKPATLDLWMHSAVVLESYAPSECSIYATCSPKPMKSIAQASVLGKPLSSCFWVVEPKDLNRLVPIGAPGELLIEGPLLAREYLNDPTKTNKSFVVDPGFLERYHIGTGRRRMYRTGDLVRQNDDGTYTMLGRRDTQIEIRGQRVEIGEVEYHIARHSSHVHAVVILSQRGDFDDKKLVAAFSLPGDSGYDSITVQEGSGFDKPGAMLVASDIQHYLSQHLPDYMIPRVWIPVGKLPVNTSGKIDRLSISKYVNDLSAEELASFSEFQDTMTEGEELPATETERQIRQIWSNVLNVPVTHIAFRRSFLSYGGDSITAMQVVSACRKVGLVLTVRDVLQSNALSESALGARKGALDAQAFTEIPDEPFDLSPAQRMYFQDIAVDGLRSQGDYRFNQSVCFRLQQPFQQQAKIARAIEALAAKHPMLRARFKAKGNGEMGWQQRIEKQLVGSYRFQTRIAPDDETARAVMKASQASLDLEYGPVFAADFLELPDRQLLFLTAHHLVIDLMSWRIIAQDLEQMLRNGSVAESCAVQFPAWCSAVTQQAQQRASTKTLSAPSLTNDASHWAYWGLEHGQYMWADQTVVTAQVDEQTTSLLLGAANGALRTSPADILLTALYQSFREVFTNRSDPSVFVEGHGRGFELIDCDLSETVGWFTTLTPVHLPSAEKDGDSTVTLAKQLKDFRKLDPGRQARDFASRYLTEDDTAAALIEVLFNYHGQFQQLEHEDGLLRLDELHQPAAQSDTSSVGGRVKMQAALNVEVSVEGGKAVINIGFSKCSTRQDAIREWTSKYAQYITRAARVLSNVTPMATASDFPLTHLTNSDLLIVGQRFLAPAGIAWEDVEDILPCSPVQQGILLSQLKSPSTYRLRETCRILPAPHASSRLVDTAKLAAAWGEIVQKHSIMRTIFTALLHQDRFHQIVLKSPKANIRTFECATDADVQACINIHAAAEHEPGRPQHQFLLITTAKEGNVYGHFEISHALVDASSIQILIESLLLAYEGGTVIPGSTYSAYVSFLEDHSEEEDLRYWQDLLAKAEPCNLQLAHAPFAQPAEIEPEASASVTLQDLPGLHSFCRIYSVTVANVLQLAWSLVLASRVGTHQVSFGYLASGRDVPIDGVHTLVGPMINMMICHSDLDYDMTPSQATQTLQNRFLEGFEHQRAPLAAIQHNLHTSQRPLFNTTVSYRRAAPSSTSAQSIQLERVDAAESTDYDFNLSILASESSIELVLEYLPCASAGAVYRLLCQLRCTVEMLCSSRNASSRLGDLELLSPEDKQVIKRTNADRPSTVATCIHSLVQDVTAQQPDAEAICAWDGTMTYQALDDAASRLGYHLSTLGVGPEVMVGICMDKSRWAAVSLLAILKAGGVVLPLSTQQPQSRLRLVLDDTKAPIILVDAIQEERLAQIGPQVIKVDSAMLDGLSAAPCQPLRSEVRTSNAAWVVYTSGSTGRPKGVVLQHSALCTSIQSHGTAFGVGAHSRVLQFAAHTFDVTIQEIFTTLCRGGCVCIPSEEQRLNSLEQTIRTMDVNFLSLTSTIAGILDPRRLPAVQTVILMGEPVKPAVLDLWKHVTVLESYAPSECSIYATCSPRSMTDHKQVSVLGVPLASCFWIVDPTNYNRLCPIGAPGELLIEGPLLARGYLNDEIKTQNSFIVNPNFLKRHGLEHGQGRRMYRTGDLVRQNEDGTFTTLGRRDMQVKIWGQRVEVGEIEYWTVRSHAILRTAAAMLTQLGTTRDQGVLTVVVDFTEDGIRDMSVGADGFLEPSTSLLQIIGQVRSSLIEVLPRYMVPELFVPMAHLPLNTSGKLDRRAIQEAIATLSSQGRLEAYLPTSAVKADVNSGTERELRRLWAEVLGRAATTIGVDDNFFHVGGDSMMAMRLVQISRDAPFSLTVADIFEHPCLSDLAKILERSLTFNEVEADGQELAPFSLWKEYLPERPDTLRSLLDGVAEQCATAAELIEDVYPCTSLQEHYMLATSRRPTAYVIRRLFTLDDDVDTTRLRIAWQRTAKAAPILRTRILLGRSTGSIQVIVNESIPWQTSDTLESYLDDDRAIGMAESQQLVRLGLIVPPTGKRHFVLTAHHSVYDGWSTQLMYQQVAAFYRGQELPGLVPFTRFIAHLHRANDDKVAEYWREQLSGDVTADFPPLPHAEYQPLPTQLRRQQIEFGHRSGPTVPLPILLRAAWGILVAQNAGTNNIAFGAMLSGRNAPIAGMMEMLAPTVTTVPLRLHVDMSMTVRGFLKKVHHQATEMIPFEHTGLQRIKELLPEVAATLDIRHVFVVHPWMGADEFALFPGMTPEPSAAEMFDSYALKVDCFLGPETGRVTVEARFDQDVISGRRVERMLESFAEIAVQLGHAEQNSNHSMRISDVRTLSTSDLNQILVQNGPVPPKPEGCLHDLILKMAAQQPHAEAVCACDGNLTYAELDRWSDRLANYLVIMGVGLEMKVGLCMAKSRWAVVSMLAILRAGGTVVPLGVQLPVARIQHIIRDATASVVLADDQNMARLDNMETELLKIEPSFLRTLPMSSARRSLTPRVRPSNAAWIVYTSGSTGMPKGVVLEHGSLCTSATAHGAAFGVSSDTRALQFAAYILDAAIQEVLTTLRYGGCVCVPSESQRVDGLETCIAAMGVNFLSLTSTVAALLDPISLPAVKTIVLLGEPVNSAVLDLWMDHATLFNGYGPTECAIYSSCSPPIAHRRDASLLGSPLAGCFWVVDSSDHNRLCPIGVIGELLIEGPLLAREYLNDPFKTNCSFVTDPGFVSHCGLGSGRRMYRTGDLVRQNEDNTYSIFGRKDTQVKCRG